MIKGIQSDIRYVQFGSGKKTMVIVPGLSIGYVTDSAEAIEQAFSAFTKDYTVYLFDIRDSVPEGYTISAMGEDLSKAIRKLGLTDLYLYGCSMGGMQSIYLAGTYPELVRKLVVVSSACKASAMSEKVIGHWINLAKERKCYDLTMDMGRKIYSGAFFEAAQGAFEVMAEGMDEAVLQRFIRTAGAIRGMDLRKEASMIQCPLLIMGSEGDKVLGPEATKIIAEKTKGELYMYGKEYPHAIYDEAPNLRDRAKAFMDA